MIIEVSEELVRRFFREGHECRARVVRDGLPPEARLSNARVVGCEHRTLQLVFSVPNDPDPRRRILPVFERVE